MSKKVTVACKVSNTRINRQLEKMLGECEEEFEVVSGRNREKADFMAVSLSHDLTPKQIQKKLEAKKAKQFIVFTDGDLNGTQLDQVFTGQVVSVHKMNKQEELQEAVERIRDEVFLQELMESKKDEGKSLFQMFHSERTDTAVLVLDRSFRSLYRNEKHEQITPGRGSAQHKICWLKFRRLYEQSKPCNGCPTKILFDSNGVRIPEPTFMVRKRGRDEIFCTKLQVFPIVDWTRNRVVASVEMALAIEPGEFQDEKTTGELIERILREILHEGFTRSRVYSYSKRANLLLGEKQESFYPEGKILRDFEHMVLPFDRHNEQLFRRGVPRKRKYSGQDDGDVDIFGHIFLKDKAPVCVEFPIKEGNLKIGKLVVDKFEPSGRKPSEIISAEQRRVLPYVKFLSALLRNSSRSRIFDTGERLKECEKKLVDKIVNCSSREKVFETIVDKLPEYMYGFVSSAFLREPDKMMSHLKLTKHLSHNWLGSYVNKRIPISNGKNIAAVAYQTERPVALLLNNKEKRKYEQCRGISSSNEEAVAKCSLPVIVEEGGEQNKVKKYILNVQGPNLLLKPEVIACLQVVINTACTYCSNSDKNARIVVLGPEGSRALRRIYKIIDEKGIYEPLLMEEWPDIPDEPIENKVRTWASQSRFVIIEDSSASGHIVECKMCLANRIIVIILRKKNNVSTIMQRGYPIDYKFVKEYEYEENVNSKQSLERVIEKATKWAEGVRRRRKKGFEEIRKAYGYP